LTFYEENGRLGKIHFFSASIFKRLDSYACNQKSFVLAYLETGISFKYSTKDTFL